MFAFTGWRRLAGQQWLAVLAAPIGVVTIVAVVAVVVVLTSLAYQSRLQDINPLHIYVLSAVAVSALGIALLALIGLLLRQKTLQELYLAEQARRLSERQFAAFFHSSPVAMCVARAADGIMVDVNDVFIQLSGYSRAELLGRTPLDLGAISVAGWESFDAAVKSGQARNVEMVVTDKSGKSLHCLFSSQILDLPEEQVVLVSVVDVTSRKQAEAMLAASQAMYQLLAENSVDVVSLADAEGNVLYSSPANVRRLGYSEDELNSLDLPAILQLIHPDDRGAISATLQHDIEHNLPTTSYEYRIRTKEGSYLWLEDKLRRQFDEQGRLLRTIISSRDITERKQIETELRDSEERFRLMTEIAPVALTFSRLSDGVILYVNPHAAEMAGVPANAIVGSNAANYYQIAPEQRTKIIAEMQSRGIVRDVEAQVGLPDQRTIWSFYSAAMGQYQGEPVILAMLYDITERKQLQDALRDSEQALRVTNEALERRVAERTAELRKAVADLELANAGKDAFLAAVSHELRTPLTGILTICENFSEEVYGALTLKQAHNITLAHQSGQRLLALVNNVLQYTELVAGRRILSRQPCRLAEICARAVRAALPEAERKQQQILQVIEPVDLEIESDAQAVVSVLTMLLENAVKFTPDNGTVGVTITAVAEEKAVCIEVMDNGIGMSEEQVASLFVPLSQGDKTLARRFAGIGLGLTYTNELVKHLGGTITAHSSLGHGSRFIITLPYRVQ